MTSSEFVDLAIKGFGLGFGLGFLLWSFCYAVRILRKSIISGMRIIE